LSVRDPERWYESTRDTIYELTRVIVGSPVSRPVFALVGLFTPGASGVGRMVNEIVWQGIFDGRFENRSHAIELFERHNEEVRQRVPQKTLLVYEVKEGWRPLCEFLGVEEPNKPFPRLNDTAEMQRRIRFLRALSRRACRPGTPGRDGPRNSRETPQADEVFHRRSDQMTVSRCSPGYSGSRFALEHLEGGGV
jgi:hypothetical protein